MCTVFFEDVLIGEVVHYLLSVRLLLSEEKRIEPCHGRHVDSTTTENLLSSRVDPVYYHRRNCRVQVYLDRLLWRRRMNADVTDANGDVTVDGDVMTVDIADTKTVDEVETELITGARAVENTTDGVVDEISVDYDVLVVAVVEVVVKVAGIASRIRRLRLG